MYDVVDTMVRHIVSFFLQNSWYLSWRPLLFDDELLDSPHQFGRKCSIVNGTLATFIAFACALHQMYLPEGVLLRLNSRESVDWLMPTIRAISFLAVFLCSNAKICDLCSEVSCLYISNTKIINLEEFSKGNSFFRIAGIALALGAARPGREGLPRCFS